MCGVQPKDHHPVFFLPLVNAFLFHGPLQRDPLVCLLLFVSVAWQPWQLASWEGFFFLLLNGVTEEVVGLRGQHMGGLPNHFLSWYFDIWAIF